MGKNGINRICIHHTAGYGSPNNDDLAHYHIIIDNKGNYFKGHHSIEDNINCKDGNYAQHCALGNTGTIGVAVCGNVGFNTETRYTKSPLTQPQMEALYKKCAQLCIEYDIEVTPTTVYTHMEYDHSPNGAHDGKIDIVYIPYNSIYSMEKVGEYIRSKIQWYKDKLQDKA